jgi:hypothetical protein
LKRQEDKDKMQRQHNEMENHMVEIKISEKDFRKISEKTKNDNGENNLQTTKIGSLRRQLEPQS